MSRYLRQVWALAAKDLRVEFRTRERVAAMGAFVVLTSLLFNYAVDWTLLNPRDLASALIWMIIVLGGLLGLGRTFELEKEDGAMEGLLVGSSSERRSLPRESHRELRVIGAGRASRRSRGLSLSSRSTLLRIGLQ